MICAVSLLSLMECGLEAALAALSAAAGRVDARTSPRGR